MPLRNHLLLLVVVLGACKDGPPPPAAIAATPLPTPPAPTGSAVTAPSPVSGVLPSDAPRPLERRAECNKEGCHLTHLVPDEVRPALSDGAPAAIWEHSLGERATVVFPRDEMVEVLGVVLDGSLDVTPMEAAPKAVAVGARWAAFRAPGGGVTLSGAGGKPARLALVIATTEQGRGLGAHLDQRDRPGAPPSWTWKARPGRVETWSFADRADLAWGGGAYHARLGLDGAERPAVALDLLRMSADAGVPEHVHDHAWEILAMLEGDGAVARRAAGGEDGGARSGATSATPVEERTNLRPGAIVAVPPALAHAWKPSGRAPFFAIQVFAPPGPEARYKKLAQTVAK